MMSEYSCGHNLESALTLFAALNASGIRYGAFKSTRALTDGVAGVQDLDILVARNDMKLFTEILSAHHGFHALTVLPLTSVGREDWFVPDFEAAKYLHMDVHTAVLLGGKFTKTLHAFAYEDVEAWLPTSSGLPMVSPLDETRITLSRIAFRQSGWFWQRWVRPTGDWKHEITELWFSPDSPDIVTIPFNRLGREVTLRRAADGFEVRASDLRAIRKDVRRRNHVAAATVMSEWLRNYWRMAIYKGVRVLNSMSPGVLMDRRHPVGGGAVVAIIAPDGMGKSTQVKRLSKIFRWKFSAFAEYMGTGDGRGWFFRRLANAFYAKRKAKFKSSLALEMPMTGEAKTGLKRRVLSLALVFYGVLAAMERLGKVKRAHRAAAKGFIVICDRWPQNLQAGLLDGPVPLPDPSLFPGIKLLLRLEHWIYDQIAASPPSLFLHMVADYQVSVKRKPGAISREAFEKRIVLMQRLRERYSDRSVVIDGSHEIDAVTSDLFRAVWSRL